MIFGRELVAAHNRLFEATFMENGMIQLDMENAKEGLAAQFTVDEIKSIIVGLGRIVWHAESDGED